VPKGKASEETYTYNLFRDSEDVERFYGTGEQWLLWPYLQVSAEESYVG
jgi:hypothetical protein